MSKKKEKAALKKMIMKFLNSAKVLLCFSFLIIVVLICLSYHLMKSSKTYLFNGQSDYINILNGVISLNYDVNLLEGSDIEYINEKDEKVVKYAIGYYVLKGENLLPIAVKKGEDEEGFSLKGILAEVSAYNIAEPYHNNSYFTKEKIKALEDGFYFIIEAKTVKGEEILDKTKLNLAKVSK